MAIQVVSQPEYEPVSLAAAREWLRLESDDTVNTNVLAMLVKAMREEAENLTQRAFIPRQLKLTLPQWPLCPMYGTKIELPFPPLMSVDSFKYTDTSGVLQTLATDQYVVHDEEEPAFIIPAYGVTWPSIRIVPNSIQVTFTAGYSPHSPDDEQGHQEAVPAAVKLWMESKAATHNEFREQVIAGTIVSKIPRDYTDGLLDSLMIGTRLF